MNERKAQNTYYDIIHDFLVDWYNKYQDQPKQAPCGKNYRDVVENIKQHYHDKHFNEEDFSELELSENVFRSIISRANKNFPVEEGVKTKYLRLRKGKAGYRVYLSDDAECLEAEYLTRKFYDCFMDNDVCVISNQVFCFHMKNDSRVDFREKMDIINMVFKFGIYDIYYKQQTNRRGTAFIVFKEPISEDHLMYVVKKGVENNARER